MKPYKAVIFDLDGTLLDTLADLAASLNAVLTRHGYGPQPLHAVRRYLGNGAERLCRLALPKSVKEEEFQTIFNEFKAYYKDHCHIATKPYDGILGLLKGLQAQGIKTAIVSNKPDESVRALRDDFFPAVTLAVGQTEGIPRKPSPTMVEKALHDLGIKKDDAVYIGDSEVDLETARRAAMDVILVSWGFRDRAELKALGKAVIVDTREALSAYLLGSVQKSD